MRKSPFLVTMAALAFGLVTEAQAQSLSDEDLLKCEELLNSIEPGNPETLEQQRCLALLAELGVQPAFQVGQFDEWNDNTPPH
jgi:hypothetical protein